ncbi:MAG: PAS domain S-box protein, partial [Cyanobacteria bacterium J06636_16]
MNAKQHPNLPHGEAFLQQLMLKYQEPRPDLIIVSDDPGLRLLLEHREQYFNNLPIVFLGINKVEPELLTVPNMTGVFENHSTAETALGALKQTKTDNLIVLNDSTETGQANLGGIEELQQHPQAPREIIILNDIRPENIEKAFGQYPRHWPVLVLGQLRQDSADGPLLSFPETAQILRERLSNPLYAESFLFLGHGVVGGKILDAEHHAYQAVDLAQKILQGEAAEQIAPITNAKNLWFFDFRELQRFRFKSASLPEGSQVINEVPPFYRRYEHLVWLAFGSFLIALLIILLLMEIIRRRAAEEKILRENEQRYKDLSEAGASIFWELDSELRFTYISGDTQALNGQKATQFLGQSLYEIVKSNARFDFDWDAFLRDAQANQPIQDFTFRIQQEGKAVRIFKLNGKPIRDRCNTFQGHRGIIREITKEYHLAETLAYQATYDSLTGLLNRCSFSRRIFSSAARRRII